MKPLFSMFSTMRVAVYVCVRGVPELTSDCVLEE